MKHKRTIILCAAFSLLASVTISYVAIHRSSNSFIEQNIEALSDGESLNDPIWTRFYRDDLGYNCAKPGKETC